MQYEEILRELELAANAAAVAGMARYGIDTSRAYGVQIPKLRKIASKVGRNHALAGRLWESGIHEARILASLVEEPTSVTPDQMDLWASEFTSWDVCDQCCNNLFWKLPVAHAKAEAWTLSDEEFVKRAGFVLMAVLAVHDKAASDETFLRYLLIIGREAADGRNFVKKAVNWALRQIGKRNRALNKAAIQAAERIRACDSRPGKWIASDALRELTSEAVQQRLGRPG